MKIVTSKCHVDNSAKSRYDVILGRDIIIELVLDLKFSKHVIICGDVPYEG